jgi:hypothetical protein
MFLPLLFWKLEAHVFQNVKSRFNSLRLPGKGLQTTEGTIHPSDGLLSFGYH